MKKQSTKRVPCFKRWSRKGYGAFASIGREVKIGVLSTTMSLVTIPSFAAVESDSVRTESIHDVIVVALRGGAAARSMAEPAVIADPLTLKFSALASIESAMEISPQLDIRLRGPRASQADISIRGGSPDQAMVLLNGVNFSDARTGHQTHSLPLPFASIRAVDFIPLTGSIGAFSGAIDYRTEIPEKNTLSAEVSGGEFGTYGATITAAVRGKRSSVTLAASYDHSDGYIHNTDYSRFNLFLRATHSDQRLGNFDFQAGYQSADFGSNGFYSLAHANQWEATRTALSSLVWSKNFTERFTLSALVSYRLNTDRYELYRPGSPDIPSSYGGANYHLTDNVGASIWGDYKWGWAGVTSLGVDYTYNHIWSTVLGLPSANHTIGGVTYKNAKDRSAYSYYLRHKLRFGRFDANLTASINSGDYGVTPLWGAVLGYNPIEGLRAQISAASTMRLPTFTDLYYNTVTHIGNSNLTAERATTYSLDLSYRRGRFSTLATLYYRSGSNIIDWVHPVGETIWQSEQITSLSTLGFEFTGLYRAERGFIQSLSLSYAHIKSDKAAGDKISKYALDYMRNKAALTANFRIVPSLVLSVNSSVYDRNGVYEATPGLSEQFKPYFLLDSRLTWNITPKIALWAECTNILDQEYFDFAGLILPGRWVMAGARFNVF